MNLNKSKKVFIGLVKVCIVFSASLLYSQDLVVEETTIESEESFTAQSITVGPNVTIDSSGKVTTHSNSLAIKAPFYIVGGELTVISGSVPVSISEQNKVIVPENFNVRQNYPNPFNPLTQISYDLPTAGYVEITIFSVSGQKVKQLLSTEQAAGNYTVTWDATDSRGNKVSSGIYFYKVMLGKYRMIRKMNLIK